MLSENCRNQPTLRPIRKCLIVANTAHEAYEAAWARSLTELGVCVSTISATHYLPRGLWGWLEKRYQHGNDVARFNRHVTSMAINERPDVILVYQGTFCYPSTIRALSEKFFVVGYHNDDPTGRVVNRLSYDPYRHIRAALPHFHGFHSYRECSLEEVRALGIQRSEVLMPYYIPWLDYPRNLAPHEKARFGCDICFAGHYEPDSRGECLQEAVRTGLHVRVYGKHRSWRQVETMAGPNRLAVQKPVWGDDYRKALCGARVATCFFSKLNRDQYTRRAFEIPACGVFLLAERTAAMVELYREGREAEFFDCPEEFVAKAKYYLSNEAARNRIARAGQERAMSSGYDVRSRMQQWLHDVSEWKREQPAAKRAA